MPPPRRRRVGADQHLDQPVPRALRGGACGPPGAAACRRDAGHPFHDPRVGRQGRLAHPASVVIPRYDAASGLFCAVKGRSGQMVKLSPIRGSAAGLRGRRRECGVLGRLIEAVSAGESRALVVRGEPGVGKTALLDYVARRAAAYRVVRAMGVQSEMELAFAGLHQVCAPMLDRLERLPLPQREALETAFGINCGPVPDRFLIGLAVLGLLSEAAAERPLVCLVDDAQWLDEASFRVLGFVARRLLAEPVLLLMAARETGDPRTLSGLPALTLGGLADADARGLLDDAVPGQLDPRVRDRIV